jgi:ribonuclease HI
VMIEIYTDGSGTTSDKPCGWAFVIVKDGIKIHEQNGSLPKGTNNVAELTAAVKGLAYAVLNHNGEDIVLVSDSQLVLNYANGNYRIKAIHLVNLYRNLRKLYDHLGAEGRWVKGHSGDEYNELCDKLAKSAREAESEIQAEKCK